MRKGFTLIEIMIVVAIIALLAAIAVPKLLKVKIKANEANAQAALRAISAASESFASANNGNYPRNWAALTGADPAYLDENYQATSPRHGYNFTCTFGTRDYTCVATPVSTNTGTKIYTIQTGEVLTSAEYSSEE